MARTNNDMGHEVTASRPTRWDNISFDVGKALLAWYPTTVDNGFDHAEEEASFAILPDELGEDVFEFLTAILAGEIEIALPEAVSTEEFKGRIFDKINSAYMGNWQNLDETQLTRFLQIAAENRYEEWCGWTINCWPPALQKQMYRANAGLPIDLRCDEAMDDGPDSLAIFSAQEKQDSSQTSV